MADADIQRAATSFNNAPLVRVVDAGVASVGNAARSMASLFALDRAGVVLETLKLAEDSLEHVVVRLYECYGARGRWHLTWAPTLLLSDATACNVLERAFGVDDAAHGDNDASTLLFSASAHHCALDFKPFQIRTLKFKFAA